MKPSNLIVLFVVAGAVYADPMPTIVWSGVATVSGDVGGMYSYPYASTTSDGLDAGSDETDDGSGGPFGNFMAETQFTVTTAGEFLLSSSVADGVFASTCSPVGACLSYPLSEPDLAGSFTASAIITGPDGVLQTLSNSGSDPYSNCQVFQGTYGQAAACNAGLSLSDSASNVVYLATGEYTLQLNESDRSGPDDDSSGGVSFSADLVPASVPTPEPSKLGCLIAGMAIIFLAKARRVRARTVIRDKHARPLPCRY